MICYRTDAALPLLTGRSAFNLSVHVRLYFVWPCQSLFVAKPMQLLHVVRVAAPAMVLDRSLSACVASLPAVHAIRAFPGDDLRSSFCTDACRLLLDVHQLALGGQVLTLQ